MEDSFLQSFGRLSLQQQQQQRQRPPRPPPRGTPPRRHSFRKHLYLLRGLPGSGKTTLARCSEWSSGQRRQKSLPSWNMYSIREKKFSRKKGNFSICSALFSQKISKGFHSVLGTWESSVNKTKILPLWTLCARGREMDVTSKETVC
uniref:NEDD4 binding protein 2 like 1 n=1 Tax=Gorilla gorilla gorilla TaxID=9595 RepID=A0A2I2YR28_GORGO